MPQQTDGPISVRVDTRELEAMFDEAPRIANSELNRGLGGAMSAFAREFSRERLTTKSRGIRVQRKARAAARGRAVKLPARARAIGFKGQFVGARDINGKRVIMRTSSPLLYAHEVGETIRPKGKKYLVIRAAKGSARAEAQKISKGGRGFRTNRFGRRVFPVVAKVKQVKLKPKLGFLSGFARYVQGGDFAARLQKIAERIVQRMARVRARGGRR